MSEKRVFQFGECRPGERPPLMWKCPECGFWITHQDRVAHLEAIFDHEQQHVSQARPA